MSECADCKQIGVNVQYWMQETFKWNKQSQDERARLAHAVKALKAVSVDAIKCEQSKEPTQYYITEWSMAQVRDVLKGQER